jgi:hypothetical protein
MGHELAGSSWPKKDLENDLSGMADYAWAMNDLVKERGVALAKIGVKIRVRDLIPNQRAVKPPVP